MKERKKKNQFLLLSIISLFLFITANENESEQQKPTWRKHFVLIHGAGHGAWSWYKLVVQLRSSGHNVTASGIDPKQVKDIPSSSDYFRPLMDFMAIFFLMRGWYLWLTASAGWLFLRQWRVLPTKSLLLFLSLP